MCPVSTICFTRWIFSLKKRQVSEMPLDPSIPLGPPNHTLGPEEGGFAAARKECAVSGLATEDTHQPYRPADCTLVATRLSTAWLIAHFQNLNVKTPVPETCRSKKNTIIKPRLATRS